MKTKFLRRLVFWSAMLAQSMFLISLGYALPANAPMLLVVPTLLAATGVTFIAFGVAAWASRKDMDLVFKA